MGDLFCHGLQCCPPSRCIFCSNFPLPPWSTVLLGVFSQDLNPQYCYQWLQYFYRHLSPHLAAVLHLATADEKQAQIGHLRGLSSWSVVSLNVLPVIDQTINVVYRAVISSILGIVYRFRQNTTSDITWAFAPEIILVAFELEATIMVGCFPMLPALFKTTSPLALASIWYRIESAGSRIIHRASERSLRSLYTTDSRSKEPKTSQISDIRKTTSLESHEIHLIQSREA